MKAKLNWMSLVSVLFVALWLFSCSGGGDDGGSADGGGSPTTPAIDGDDGGSPTTPASGPTNEIDAASVDEIMRAIEDLGIGCEIGSAGSSTSTALRSLAEVAQRAVNEAQTDMATSKTRGAPVTESESLPGTCSADPGTLDLILTVDEETGEISGDLTFTSFCLDLDGSEVTIGGGAEFDGQLILNASEELEGLVFTFDTTPNITIDSDDMDATIVITGLVLTVDEDSGAWTIGLTLTSASVTADDGTGAETFSASDVDIDITIGSDGSVSATLSGTVTINGETIDILTPTPITVDEFGEITGGVILIEGANNTSIQITYAGSGYAANVAADTDGDGELDDYNETMDCSGVEVPDL